MSFNLTMYQPHLQGESRRDVWQGGSGCRQLLVLHCLNQRCGARPCERCFIFGRAKHGASYLQAAATSTSPSSWTTR